MQLIRLTYKYADIKPSTLLLLYFRLVGVYVRERFYDSQNDFQKEIGEFLRDYPEITPIQEDRCHYDAEIFLVRDREEYEAYRKLRGENALLVVCGNREAIGEMEELQDAVVWYDPAKEGAFLRDILRKLLYGGQIDKNEVGEFLKAAAVCVKFRYASVTLSTKYFYNINDQGLLSRLFKDYWDIAKKLFTSYKKFLKMGRCCERLEYAFLSVACDVNLYCQRNSRVNLFKSHALETLGQDLEKNGPASMQSSAKILLGQIYDAFLGDTNHAYELYVEGCNSTGDYNAYAFFLKGQYWQNFVQKYREANKYYLKSVMIWPEYYRAWYKLGFCFFKLDRVEEAVVAYDCVRRILEPRLKANTIRPMEIEHLFLACRQCGEILSTSGRDIKRAIQYDLCAAEAWEKIEETSFWDLMTEDEEERRALQKEIKERLSIRKIYEHLYGLYGLIGDKGKTTQYEKKYNDAYQSV